MQQMQWTRRGAHSLLRTRTKTLDGTLRSTFERWYPGLANENVDLAIHAEAACFLMLPRLAPPSRGSGRISRTARGENEASLKAQAATA